MTHISTHIPSVEKIAQATFVVPLLTLVFAANLVSLWSGHPSIVLQSWSTVLSELTPTFLVEVVLLMAFGYWIVLPLLQWATAWLVSLVPVWLVPYPEYGPGWLSIDAFEKKAISQNNSAAFAYAQKLREDLRHERDIAGQVGLFLLFGGLDWMHSGSLAASLADYGWHGLYVRSIYVAVGLIYLWIVVSGYRAGDYRVFVEDALHSDGTPTTS